MIGCTAFGRGQAFVNLGAAQADVVGAVQRQRLGRGAIAARATDFLIIGLDAFGQIGMGDPADVRFVDTHPERDGRNHNQPVLGGKAFFNAASVGGLHPAMIETSSMAVVDQCLGQGFRLGAGAAVNDARLAASCACEIKDLTAGPVLGLEG